MNKIKAGKASGVCGIYPEYIQHGSSDALRTLHKIVTQVWKEEVVPEDWHQGIIIPLYKGKGSTSECSNVCTYHPCKNQTPTLLSHRCPQQSGFMPGRSTCDRIATLCNIDQRRQDFGHPTFAALLTPMLHLTLLADPRCGYF